MAALPCDGNLSLHSSRSSHKLTPTLAISSRTHSSPAPRARACRIEEAADVVVHDAPGISPADVPLDLRRRRPRRPLDEAGQDGVDETLETVLYCEHMLPSLSLQFELDASNARTTASPHPTKSPNDTTGKHMGNIVVTGGPDSSDPTSSDGPWSTTMAFASLCWTH